MRDGADGIEFDVRLARDLVPVVIHDAKLKRTASINKLVSEFTASELGRIDVSSWFQLGPSRKVETEPEFVPTLAKVFEVFATINGVLYVEMKGEPVGDTLPAVVARLIREHSFIDKVVVESFDLAAIAEMKRLDPTIRTAALFEPNVTQHLAVFKQRDVASVAAAAKADEVALHRRLARESLITELRRLNFEVVVWTVEKPEWVSLAQRLEIKALITNDPAALIKHRRS